MGLVVVGGTARLVEQSMLILAQPMCVISARTADGDRGAVGDSQAEGKHDRDAKESAVGWR